MPVLCDDSPGIYFKSKNARCSAATPYVAGVTIGGIMGHAVCTGAAVLGGRHMATRISERAVAICGGVLFVLFGIHSLVSGGDGPITLIPIHSTPPPLACLSEAAPLTSNCEYVNVCGPTVACGVDQ